MPFLVLFLLVLGGCASSSAVLPSTGGNTSVTVARGRSAVIGSREDAFVAPTRLATPVDSAWPALMKAYGALGLPADVVTREGHTVGATRISVRGRFLGRAPSTFLTCGGTAGVAEVADQHHVQMSVFATLTRDGTGTRLQTRVAGTAKDPFTSTPPRPCTTTGALEVELDSLVSAILRGETVTEQPALESLPPPQDLDPLAGGGLADVSPLFAAREKESGPRNALVLALGGAAGAALGTAVGSLVGADCETRCLNARGTLGPLVGNAVLVPAAVHLTNARQGSLLRSFLASAGWASLGAVVAGLSGEEWGVLAVAPGQLLTSVLIEHATSRDEP